MMFASTRNAVLLALFFTLASTSLFPNVQQSGEKQAMFLGLTRVESPMIAANASVTATVMPGSGMTQRHDFALRVRDRLRADLLATAKYYRNHQQLAVKDSEQTGEDSRERKLSATES